MAEFNTTGLEDVIEAFSRREQATVEAVPKMLKAGADVLVEAQKAEAQAMGLHISIHTPTQGVTANTNKIPLSYSPIFVYY